VATFDLVRIGLLVGGNVIILVVVVVVVTEVVGLCVVGLFVVLDVVDVDGVGDGVGARVVAKVQPGLYCSRFRHSS